MDKFLIKGPCKVKGTVNISGSKNASLPILAASILFDEMVEIKNLPNVRDIDTMLSLIKSLGFNVKQNKNSNSVVIKKSKKINWINKFNSKHLFCGDELPLDYRILVYYRVVLRRKLPNDLHIPFSLLQKHLTMLAIQE